jgi:PAS domain S-box-containing protein
LTERLIQELRNYQLDLESANRRLKEIAQEKTRIADSLAVSESRYRALVESTDDFIYRVNREGEYLFMNTRTRVFHGLSNQAMAGRHYGEFHDKAGTAVFMDRVRQVFDGGTSIRQEHCLQGRHYLRTLSPVKEADGTVMSVTVVSKEITDQKKLQADLENRNEALRQEQVRRSLLSKRLIDLLEADRRRIAGDLHDQVGQRLTSLKLNLEQVGSEIPGPNASLCKKIDEAIQKAAHVLHDIKHISRQLRPPILDKFGLAQSLVQLLMELEKEGMKTHFFQKGCPSVLTRKRKWPSTELPRKPPRTS